MSTRTDPRQRLTVVNSWFATLLLCIVPAIVVVLIRNTAPPLQSATVGVPVTARHQQLQVHDVAAVPVQAVPVQKAPVRAATHKAPATTHKAPATTHKAPATTHKATTHKAPATTHKAPATTHKATT
ncbi:MAG TPA: hypothetical protein VFE19_12225, partial [Jatrophihabitantaceae bacterium]|nr:hypothetical protein [Jatrophihabitantaceae bacterium]